MALAMVVMVSMRSGWCIRKVAASLNVITSGVDDAGWSD